MAPSRDVSAERWQASRTFHHSQFPPERLAQVDLGLPVRDEAPLAALAAVAEELLAAIEAAA